MIVDEAFLVEMDNWTNSYHIMNDIYQIVHDRIALICSTEFNNNLWWLRYCVDLLVMNLCIIYYSVNWSDNDHHENFNRIDNSYY